MALDAPSEGLKIEISENAIQVEGKPIALENLNSTLETERKRQVLISQSNSDVQVNSKILIIADQHIPYGKLKQVLASAASNGFTDFKLVAVNKQ